MKARARRSSSSCRERIFVKPLARALIEQRRILALDAEAKPRVLTALDALSIAPEKFTPELSHLSRPALDLLRARPRQDRRPVARRGGAAVGHGGEASRTATCRDAEQALRQAQEALRQALERGASDEEIKKLTDDLRAALDKFMQALAEQMRKNPQQLARPLDPQYPHAAASKTSRA